MLLLEIAIAILIGICFGIITGITPGIHINLVALLLLSFAPFFLGFTSALVLAAFIISMSITHTFLDALPSIYLGAPDSDMVMGVLPGHRLLLKGQGYEAVKLTIIGSMGGLILAIVLVPILIPLTSFFYPFISDYIGWFLLLVVIFMIYREKNKLMALFIFLLSGILGIVVFSTPNLKDPLLPMLSGLFGISMLTTSIFEKVRIPKQNIASRIKVPKLETIKALFSGTFSGFLTTTFPGLGPAQGAVISMQLTPNLSEYAYLILVGSINTVNMILSLVTVYTLDKARNGAIIALKEIIVSLSLQNMIILFACGLAAGVISCFLAMWFARFFSSIVSKVNYGMLCLVIILFVSVLVFIFTGWLGMLVMITAAFIGLMAPMTDVGRAHAMGCLMLPVILYFLL
ncbi:tripartite tricarboxylate transporter permease [Candidatus Woesearchaeota archaeon]|nr:tripartite tricarboxylate transporter permease [Candidatus Woesearchaeota archaeon]